MTGEVRVRFSPSPTGELHVGTARTALFNWLFARHAGGTFILRIEDTDPERSERRFEESIMRDLAWLGLKWDEGPDVGGPFAPYRQSERAEEHRRAADDLLAKGRAYMCYCTPDELERSRREALDAGRPPRYGGRCRDLTQADRDRLISEGRGATVRYRVEAGVTTVADLLRGPVGFDHNAIGDFVLLRSDGSAGYNFAVTVDDAAMRISHVIRGEDHLANTARQLMLYNDLGLGPPAFVHLPMINGPDGAKLSKRHGAVGIGEFRSQGYLQEAIVNYLALLGWSHPEGKEIFSLEEAAEAFDLARVSKSAARFDADKLRWVNAEYIREMDLGRLLALLEAAAGDNADLKGFAESGKLEEFVSAARASVSTIGDFAACATIYTKKVGITDANAVAQLSSRQAAKVIETATRILAATPDLDEVTAKQVLGELKGAMARDGLSGREVFMPLRAALTGTTSGPELYHVLSILGREESLSRLSDAARLARGDR